MSTQKHRTLFVSGTHCSACKHLIEETLAVVSDIAEVTVSLQEETISFITARSESNEVFAANFTTLLAEYGYVVHPEKQSQKQHPREWLYACIVVMVAVLGYIGLEQAGLAAMITGDEATLTTAFVVGLVASVSTCLAVVGGLVLSISATYAHEGRGWRPQALFHLGRTGGFLFSAACLACWVKRYRLGFLAR